MRDVLGQSPITPPPRGPLPGLRVRVQWLDEATSASIRSGF